MDAIVAWNFPRHPGGKIPVKKEFTASMLSSFEVIHCEQRSPKVEMANSTHERNVAGDSGCVQNSTGNQPGCVK